jgi:CheY-like chemotaxis protein
MCSAPRATFESPASPLPVPSASASHGTVNRKRTYVPSNSFTRIFVVDDEHVIASSLAAILTLHGYSATAFTSPQEALAAARSSAPDLLVSDVAMPGLTGVDLAIQIKAACPECRILLFSGQATTEDLLKEARGQGHNFQLLRKPVHPSVMLLRIDALAAESSTAAPRESPNPDPALPASARILQMPSPQ